MSTGDWFAWINADDYYESNAFSSLAEFFKKFSEAGVIYGNCYAYYSKNKIILDVPKNEITYNDLITTGNQIYGPASFFNMKALAKVGEFNEDMKYWMDYEMYVRISKVMNLQYVDLNIANFRVRPHQKSRDKKELDKEMYTIIKKYNPKWKFYTIFFIKNIKFFLKNLNDNFKKKNKRFISL